MNILSGIKVWLLLLYLQSITIRKRPKGIAFVVEEEKLRALKKKTFQFLNE